MNARDDERIWKALEAQAAETEEVPDANDLAELAAGTGLARSRARTARQVFPDPRLLRAVGIERRIVRSSRIRVLSRGAAAAAVLCLITGLGSLIWPQGAAAARSASGAHLVAGAELPALLAPLAEHEVPVFREAATEAPELGWPRGFVSPEELRFATRRAEGLRVQVVAADDGTTAGIAPVDGTAAIIEALAAPEWAARSLEARLLAADGSVIDSSDFEIRPAAELPAAAAEALSTLSDPARRAAAEGNAWFRLGHYARAAQAWQRHASDGARRGLSALSTLLWR